MTRTEKPKSLPLKRTGIPEKLEEFQGFPGGASGKEPACQCGRQETQVQPLGGEGRKWQPPPVSVSGKVNGQRSLAGCGPRRAQGQTRWSGGAQAGRRASLTVKCCRESIRDAPRACVCVRACACVRARACVHALSRFSHVRLFVTPWTVSRQARLSLRFSRQEYGSGLSSPSPGILCVSY